jgi:hypothetical protein
LRNTSGVRSRVASALLCPVKNDVWVFRKQSAELMVGPW